jgi:hypothetical protein
MEGSSHSLKKGTTENLPGGTEENHKNPQDSRSPDRDLNHIFPEFGARMRTTRPRRLVSVLERALLNNT